MPGRNGVPARSLGGNKPANVLASRRNEFFEWDQLYGEPDVWYARFFCYLKLDPTRRSVQLAKRTFIESHPVELDEDERLIEEERIYHYNSDTLQWEDTIKLSRMPRGATKTWYEQSEKWHWTERAHAYDRHLYQTTLEAIAQRRLKAAVEAADLGEELRTKAAQAAKLLVATTQAAGVHPDDGRAIYILAANLTPEQIVRMAEVGVKIEQLALGSPTENIAQVEHPVEQAVESARERLKQKLFAIKERRAQASTMDGGPIAVIPAPDSENG